MLPTRPRIRPFTWVGVLAVVASMGGQGLAGPPIEGDDDSPPARYLGAFWGVQLHTGAAWRVEADGDPPGPLVGVSVRAATLMSLLDLQLSFLTSRYDVTDTVDASVARYTLGLEAHLHPFFISHLRGTNFAYWRAALHLTLGAGLDVVDVSAEGMKRSKAVFGWHIGAGSDIPLGDVERGWGMWLGLSYRLRFVDAATGIRGLGDFDEHTFVLTIGYRNNDIGFLKVPRPGELNDLSPGD